MKISGVQKITLSSAARIPQSKWDAALTIDPAALIGSRSRETSESFPSILRVALASVTRPPAENAPDCRIWKRITKSGKRVHYISRRKRCLFLPLRVNSQVSSSTPRGCRNVVISLREMVYGHASHGRRLSHGNPRFLALRTPGKFRLRRGGAACGDSRAGVESTDLISRGGLCPKIRTETKR
jgi:hypothetical protein